MATLEPRRPELLLFLHVPKAGGSTLKTILDREYSGRPTWSVNWPAGEDVAALEDRASIELIEGHFGFGLHRQFPQEATYITLVRDPVARVVSHFDYVRREPAHPLHRQVVEENLSLEDYVTAGLSDELENGQVRLLSEQGLLDEAKRNLVEFFPVVGVTERFDESLLLFRNALGWRRRPLYARINATGPRDRSPVDPATRELILTRNSLDADLYAFVVERLDEAIGTLGPDFQRALRRFRRVNGPVGSVAHHTRGLRRALRAR